MASPKWLELARKELGTKEYPGPANNPTVQQYYVDAVSKKHPDEVAWCAAFVGAMLARAGVEPSKSLLARSYLRWGIKLKAPKRGAVVVFPRGEAWQGHVGFVESFGREYLVVISGNDDNSVKRDTYLREQALGYRWPSEGA